MPTNLVQFRDFTGQAGSPASFAFAGAVTAGNTLCCQILVQNASAGTFSVSDNVNGPGTPWTAVPGIGIVEQTNTMAAFYFPNTAAGTPTVTVSWTLNTGANVFFFIFEIGTSVHSSVIDASTASAVFNSGSANSFTGPSVTTGNANDLLVDFIVSAAGRSPTVGFTGANPSSGWFKEGEDNQIYLATCPVSSTGTYNDAYNNLSIECSIGIVAFKKSTASSTVTTTTYFVGP